MSSQYDVIVVGARCAGSPAAMLLARKGHKVLLVDRDTFPSDTVSTHMVHPPGVAHLDRWGLLERLVATGCPAIGRYSYDFGEFIIAGSPHAVEGINVGYAPRRTILDKLLLDAAAEAGCEIREGFVVEHVIVDDGVVTGVRGHTHGGIPVSEHARVVIGADGRHSRVADEVKPTQYNEKPALQSSYYAYWSDLPTEDFGTYVRLNRGWGVIPTHDSLTLIVIGWPHAEFETNKRDVEGAYLRSLELAPEFAERVHRAKRETPYRGAMIPNFFRKPFGPGWALIGDAGYIKDPVTAWGISDAFRDAEQCATALSGWLSGASRFEESMTEYQEKRDEHSAAMFDLTCNFATLAPPPPDLRQLLQATSARQDSQRQFVSMMAGTLPVQTFFAPANVGRIFSSAQGS